MSAMPICVNCISGSELPGTPRGTTENIGPYNTYISEPTTPTQGDGKAGKAIVSFTDVFGLKLKNSKIIADLLADHTGFTVYVPDLFNGSPIDPASMSIPSSAEKAQNVSFFGKIGNTAKMLTAVPWVAKNWPTGKYKDIETFLTTLKNDKQVKRIGAVGFCYGGKPAVDFNTKGLVDVTVVNHPSFVNASSFASLKGPIMFNCAEADDMFPVKLVEQVRAMLVNDENAPAHDIKVFQGTAHSFAARPDLGDAKVKEGFEGATSRTAEWFSAKL